MKSYCLVSLLFSVLLLCAHGKDEAAGNGNLAALTAQFHSIINELGERGLNTNTYEAETAALLKRLEQFQYPGASRSNISLDWFAGALVNTQTQGTKTTPLRITIVVSSFEGMYLNSGIGTFYAALSDFLVTHGHTVSILYTRTDGADAASKTFSRWQTSYAKKGISVARLEPSSIHVTSAPLTQKAYQVYQYLKQHQQEFDVVHFPDWEGPGYFTMLAKHQGLAFATKSFIVGLHGPWRWVKHGNQHVGLTEPEDFETDWLERRSVELADFVITPSADLPRWLASQGWSISSDDTAARNRLALMPFLPGKEVQMINERQTNHNNKGATVAELVFFGRLEARKGLVLFADSMDLLAEQRPDLTEMKVTFLGRNTEIDGQASTKYLTERAEAGKWPFKLAFLTHKDRKAALDYLKEEGRGRVVVIPSLVDNAPYTIYECLYSKIPFIASDLPSIAALIAPADRDVALFPAEASALNSKIGQILENGAVAAQGLLSAETAIKTWESFYNMIATQVQEEAKKTPLEQTAKPLVSVCITHFNRPELLAMALESVQAQDYPLTSIEVVLVDDGSTDAAAIEYIESLQETFAKNNWQIIKTENKYLGAARNTAARNARGDYLVFLDDDNLAKPRQVSTYVSVAQVTGADVLTAAHDVFSGYGVPIDLPPAANVVSRSLPLGPAVALGVFKNCFGDANFFVKRNVFAQTGGFTEEKGVGQEDYEFLADAVLSGLHLEAIPEPLLYYRMHNQSNQMIFATDPLANQVRSARPFKAVMDENSDTSETLTLLARRHSIRFAQGTSTPCNLTVTSVQPKSIYVSERRLITFNAHSMDCPVTAIQIGSYACTNITQSASDGTITCISPPLPFPGVYSITVKYGNDMTNKLQQTIVVQKNNTATTIAALMVKYEAFNLLLYTLDKLFQLFAELGGLNLNSLQLIDDTQFDPNAASKRSVLDSDTEYHAVRFSLSSTDPSDPATAQATSLIQVSLANKDRFSQIGVTILDFNNIGSCDDAQHCQCTPSYTGEGCGDVAYCPNNCTYQGNCVDGPYKRVCDCYKGFTGKDCSIRTCLDDCNNHGACRLKDQPGQQPECICNTGYTGPTCNTLVPCPNDCSGHGKCAGGCQCDQGWFGNDCSQTVDSINDGGNGNKKNHNTDGVTIGMSIAAGVAGILLFTAIGLAMYLRKLRM